MEDIAKMEEELKWKHEEELKHVKSIPATKVNACRRMIYTDKCHGYKLWFSI